MRRGTCERFVLLAFLASLTAAQAFSQTNSEINSGIQFNFSSPGARSLSLGGAFIGLADDATAAYTNPAGLTNLSRPEISLEGRRFEYKTKLLSGGSATGSPQCDGRPEPCIDTNPEPIYSSSTSIVNSFSFASAVYPLGHLSLAVYWHELANFSANAQTDGAFFTGDSGLRDRLRPIQASVNLRISSVGGSAAYRFGEQFSLGVSVLSYGYTQNTVQTRYNYPGGSIYYGHADYSVPVGLETVTGDDRTVAVNVGVLWKPSRAFSVGAVFRQGPSFVTHATDASLNPDGSVNELLLDTNGKFHVPDVYGVGFAFNFGNAWTITADYDRVLYSQLTDGMVDTLNDRDHAVGYKIPDGNEGHVGIQWVFPCASTAFAVRVGSWYDPDHRIQYIPDLPASEAVLFQKGKGVWHGTGGLGLAIGEHFQIDAAGDFSSTVNVGSISTVVRF